MLNHEYLKSTLHYSVITGQLYWLKSPANNVKAGSVGGYLRKDGYRKIKVSGKCYLAHRLAWFWVTGEWPINEIDHVNGIKDVNQWLNLREATDSQNRCNTGLPSNNKSGFKGLYWNKATKKWRAHIMINKKQKHLGSFDDIEAAYAERIKAEKELHGEFAKVQSHVTEFGAIDSKEST